MNKRELSRKIQEYATAVRDMTELALILHQEGALSDEGLAETIVYSKWLKKAVEFIMEDIPNSSVKETLKQDGAKLQASIDKIEETREKP
jgi:hypothetical protein